MDVCLRFLSVQLSSSARDLGLILDPILSLSRHVNRVSRSCFDYSCHLSQISQSLPLHATTIIIGPSSDLRQYWLWSLIFLRQMRLSFKLSSGLLRTCTSKRASQSSLKSLFFSKISSTDSPFARNSNSRSALLWKTVLLALFHKLWFVATSRPRLPLIV